MMEGGVVVTSVLKEKQSEGQNKVSSIGSKDEEAIRAGRLEGLAASYSARRKVAALQRRLHSLPVGRENPEDAAGGEGRETLDINPSKQNKLRIQGYRRDLTV